MLGKFFERSDTVATGNNFIFPKKGKGLFGAFQQFLQENVT